MSDFIDNIALAFYRDDGVYLTQGVMHDRDNGIDVSQSLSGDKLFIAYKGKRYRVNVEDVVLAVLDKVRQQQRVHETPREEPR